MNTKIPPNAYSSQGYNIDPEFLNRGYERKKNLYNQINQGYEFKQDLPLSAVNYLNKEHFESSETFGKVVDSFINAMREYSTFIIIFLLVLILYYFNKISQQISFLIMRKKKVHIFN